MPLQKVDATKLCGELLLIADSDNSDSKAARHRELKRVLGKRFILLECREVENLLSPHVLKEVIRDYEKNPSLELSELDCQNRYRGEGLGKHIDELLKKEPRYIARRKYSAKGKTGTINDKLNFAKKAIMHMRTFDDLSEEAQRIACKLYRFVFNHNV